MKPLPDVLSEMTARLSASRPAMRIGIYRTCGIGDAVQLTPLFQQIRADFPDAKVTFFTSENVAPLLDGCPFLDETVPFPSSLLAGTAAEWGGFPMWRQIARRGKWDLFLDLEPRWRRSLGIMLVRAGRKGGLQGDGWKPVRLFDEFLIQHPAGLDRGHSSARYLELWQKVTGNKDRRLGYNLDHVLASPASLPELPARFVCLVPGAGNAMNPGEAKRWPFTNWLRLAGQLAEAGFIPVWLGSAEDERLFPTGGTGINLMGRLDLRQACQTVGKGMALIGNDSALFHIALATRTKAVGLFGPTNPQRTGPFRNPSSLILKARFGRVAPALLARHGTDADRDALDACVPMQELGLDLVSHEVFGYLAASPNSPELQ